MYQNIYVPLDNSDFSNRAMHSAIRLGKNFESKLTGCHVYAARMHDYRFKQMEFTLPEEYLEEAELERQRKIHDSLITMGLELISDCYLNEMERHCQEEELPFEKRMMDGKHSTEILRDLEDSDYDLVMLGVQGIGRTRDSQVGSVCQRVVRSTDRDVWVVKHVPKDDEPERDTILVGVDGSPQSFGALRTGIELAQKFGKKLELIAVYDPYLHYAVFKGIVEVLTEKAAKVFRFEEQNQLHEEVIDTGLAEIYQSHLNVAATMAKEAGVEVTKTLLDGKAFQKVLDHSRKVEPWLLIIGRIGVHNEDDDGMGSNTDNLLRLAPCDILITTRTEVPALDMKAEESIHWTDEAEERMTRVPEQVKGIARTAILRLAIEQGHSVVTSDLVTEAMDRFMPKSAAERTEKLAEALAFERAKTQPTSICRKCGVTAREAEPVKCTVCGANDFELITPEVIEQIVAAEGGTEEETTYDGRKLRWTKESREALRTLTDAYQRRRAKARIEKSARGSKLATVTLEFARRFIEEEGGVLYKTGEPAPKKAKKAETAEAAPEAEEAAPVSDDPELKLIARDRKKNPLLSRFDWTEKAIERVLRVPGGFMRDRTQRRIEDIALERKLGEIDLELVEEGIQHGLQAMQEMIGQYGGASPEMKASDEAQKGEEACPVDAEEREGANGQHAQGENGQNGKSSNGDDKIELALNEVSVMKKLAEAREDIAQ